MLATALYNPTGGPTQVLDPVMKRMVRQTRLRRMHLPATRYPQYLTHTRLGIQL